MAETSQPLLWGTPSNLISLARKKTWASNPAYSQ